MTIQNVSESPFSALQQWEPVSHPVTFGQGDHKPFWGDDGFTFDDVMDMLNPLQHIPVASKYYQEATEDMASEGAKLVGGAVFGVLTGGILGLATALVNAAVRHDTGKDLPEHGLALIQDGTESPTEISKSVIVGREPAESTGPSIELDASIASVDVSANPQPIKPSNFFVDDEAAQSLHPAERLLAISSHRTNDKDDNGSESPRQRLERRPVASTQNKVSETYHKATAEVPSQSWGEV